MNIISARKPAEHSHNTGSVKKTDRMEKCQKSSRTADFGSPASVFTSAIAPSMKSVTASAIAPVMKAVAASAIASALKFVSASAVAPSMKSTITLYPAPQTYTHTPYILLFYHPRSPAFSSFLMLQEVFAIKQADIDTNFRLIIH